jgi:hypothetical protein
MFSLGPGFRAYVSGKNRTDVLQSGDIAMQLMQRYLSLARTFTAASATSVSFTADVNNDTVAETVVLDISGNNLRRQVSGGSQVTITPYAQTLTLSYLDSAGAVIPVPVAGGSLASIRVVRVVLALARTNETATLSTAAYCRNM